MIIGRHHNIPWKIYLHLYRSCCGPVPRLKVARTNEFHLDVFAVEYVLLCQILKKTLPKPFDARRIFIIACCYIIATHTGISLSGASLIDCIYCVHEIIHLRALATKLSREKPAYSIVKLRYLAVVIRLTSLRLEKYKFDEGILNRRYLFFRLKAIFDNLALDQNSDAIDSKLITGQMYVISIHGFTQQTAENSEDTINFKLPLGSRCRKIVRFCKLA